MTEELWKDEVICAPDLDYSSKFESQGLCHFMTSLSIISSACQTGDHQSKTPWPLREVSYPGDSVFSGSGISGIGIPRCTLPLFIHHGATGIRIQV